MKEFTVSLITSEYRGDHATDVSISYKSEEGETIEQLIARTGLKNYEDRLEIRLVKEDSEETTC
ncbi:MAG: hypothetical protein EOM15_11975 [Spirochaetia bacterium]|nr:hypothetical protein [Spirochaetia bacterium]